ncbi:MAG TPA: hypothetical protein VLV55_09415, partial [Rhizomicrobium sp.]|nr:hypothetical protein [Rhizomicrobium sp.]
MRLGMISLTAVLIFGTSLAIAETDNDPYLWLSDIQGAKALSWVKGQNEKSEASLRQDPDYQRDYDAMLKVLNANDRIPEPEIVDHQWVFNFWQDA